ncbi:MAG: NAD(P)/FAD-dependent oxidoreductase [Clostridia bacterium]|nr:NAD(P)/FAD-dependent oxidoreductase [Clostridia bacterium]
MYDITVIGGGVVGGMIARTLSSYRLKICILEKAHDVAMGASSANSAIVHAGFDAAEGSLKARLNVRGSEMMKDICRELGVKYQNNGSLVIGFDEDDRATVEALCRRGIANGVKGVRVIDREELRALEPNISDDAICALYAPTGSIVCPYELTIASIGNAMDNGADLYLDFKVTDIRDDGDHFTVFSDREQIKTKYVINAAGLFSDAIARMVGDDSFTVHARRGEYILLDKECGTLVHHTIFRTPSKMGKGILVSPTVDGNLLTGPTSFDIEDKTDKSTTADGLSLVIKQSGENIDGVPFGKSITSFCGLRAVGSTGDFIINMPRSRFVNVAGIESPGLSSAPAIAEYVAQLLANSGLAMEPNPDFDPHREAMHGFREASIEEKNAIIQKDSAYGHIICRCESVSEGEILRAIRTNPRPRDLDGVKRRTRAQMGRCQGGFCSPYIVELLANEMNVPYESITKFGGASRINVGKTKEAEA